jgi:hypothetical protein
LGRLTRADYIVEATPGTLEYSESDDEFGEDSLTSEEPAADLDILNIFDSGESYLPEQWPDLPTGTNSSKRPTLFDEGEMTLEQCRNEFREVLFEISGSRDGAERLFNFWISDDATVAPGAGDAMTSPSPIRIWEILANHPFLLGIFQVVERLLIIPASEATCERAIWHLRRIMHPCCMGSSDGLILTRLRAIMSSATAQRHSDR